MIACMPSLRKHMMHIAAMVGLIGAGSGLFMGIKGFMNHEADKSLAAPKMQVTMGALSLVFLILCVRSFIEARRRRKAAGL